VLLLKKLPFRGWGLYLKKWTAISLLCLLCLNLFGYQLFFYLQIKEAKKQMKEQMALFKNEGLFTTLQINADEFSTLAWENESEFTYENKLYDLIEKKQSGNNITITCIADTKEDKLVSTFNNLNKPSSPSQTSSVSLFKFINAIYLPVQNVTTSCTTENIKNNCTCLTPQIIKCPFDISTPPPEFYM
jgi:hypothetical protein